MALCVNPVKGPNKLGSVGMPLPDVHVRIFDGDEGMRVLPAGEVGEIAFCGAAADERLLEPAGGDRAACCATTSTRRGARRWLHTGDLGYLDEDGYVFIVDRKKDLIKTSGYQVWPREIEEVLADASGGRRGRRGRRAGRGARARSSRPGSCCARVRRRPKRSCGRSAAQQLAPYKVPSHIEFRNELPKTMVGKVLRRALRDGHA